MASQFLCTSKSVERLECRLTSSLHYLQKLTKTGIITVSGPSRGQICPIRKVQHPIETMPKTTLHPCCLPASHPEPRLVKSTLGLDQSWATCLRNAERRVRHVAHQNALYVYIHTNIRSSTWHERTKRRGRVDYTGGRCVRQKMPLIAAMC
jgi:hypothetical protein